MFKIGNSKELPAIPDHLSDEGKDFVRQCLQREPSNRPTAAQLLGHPFVRNAAAISRPVVGSDPVEPPVGAPSAAGSKVIFFPFYVHFILGFMLMLHNYARIFF